MQEISKSPGICGVILAGGKASRMNGMDKPLLPLAHRPLIEHIIESALPQVDKLVISVNHNQEKYLPYRWPLVSDIPGTSAGPLVGIYSAMAWYLEQKEQFAYLACFPGDVPMFPADIVKELTGAIKRQRTTLEESPLVAWCQTGNQIQPLFSVWDMSIFPRLKKAVESGVYGPKLFFRQHPNCRVLLPQQPAGMFFNINTPAQLDQAESLLEKQKNPNTC